MSSTEVIPEGKRVRKEKIEELLKSLRFETGRVGQTTITGCWAFLPNGFCVAYGQAGGVDPELYDAKIGGDLAIKDCLINANKRLWEFEGYKLASET